MSHDDIYTLTDRAIAQSGRLRVEEILTRLCNADDASSTTLTIVGNYGVHVIDTSPFIGDIYYASEGTWDDSTSTALNNAFDSILRGVAAKLNEKPWKTIYLLPTGHPTLNMSIKALVYRVLRINTIDLYYTGSEYLELNLDLRDIAQAATKP